VTNSLPLTQHEVLLTFEEICIESHKEFAPLFSQVLHMLYDIDVVSEDAIIAWASEKQYADESDKVFLKQSEKFIQVWSFSKYLLQY
jgi:translation initiation factor eIF-2B subunit epsilon